VNADAREERFRRRLRLVVRINIAEQLAELLLGRRAAGEVWDHGRGVGVWRPGRAPGRWQCFRLRRVLAVSTMTASPIKVHPSAPVRTPI
jgi:hypothetical protein